MDVPNFGNMWSDPNNPSEDYMKFGFDGRTAKALGWFKGGSRFSLTSGRFSRTYSLRGSSKAIGAVEGICNRLARENTAPPDSFGGGFKRFSDEAVLDYEVGKVTAGKFELSAQTDLPGYDLRSGLTDPMLKNMTPMQCETLCMATIGCTAFTVNNGDGRDAGFPYRNTEGVCFLKEKPQRASRFRGAISGEMVGSWKPLQPPPTKGPGLRVRADAAPKPGESVTSYTDRLREMSKPVAGTCRQERAEAEQLAQNLQMSISANSLKVGEDVSVTWVGNDLEQRIPVWVMVSVDRPARFDGTGFFALGPDSPNPFGIAAGMGEQRALTALHARGSGATGAVRILPLEATELTATAQLVTYLRACEEEIVLKSKTFEFNVYPGEPTIVLPDQMPNGETIFTVELDTFDRVVLFNETRIRVLHTNGTEILNRAGGGVSFSPSTRFFSTVHNGKLDIVDVVDGTTVAKMDLGTLYWGFDDALVMTSVVPWGEVSLVSTLGAPLNVMEQVTGPSCCHAAPETTKVMISLENAAFAIWGAQGHFVGSLQSPGYRHAESPRGAYSSDQTGAPALYERVLASMGPVAPVSFENGFDIPGGLKSTHSMKDMTYSEVGVHRFHVNRDRIGARLTELGLKWTKLAQAETDNAGELAFQLERLGLGLRDLVKGEIIVEARPRKIPEEVTRDANGEYVSRPRQLAAVLADQVEPFSQDLTDAGWNFDWSDVTPDSDHSSECYYMDLDQQFEEWPKPLVVRALDRLARVTLDSGTVWLSQAWCTAGATYGSLRPTTALYLHDLAAPQPADRADTFRDTAFFFENDPAPLWNDHPFQMKADRDYVLLYAPGFARAGVYDRRTQKLIQSFASLPDGDLMQDAHLTEDGKVLVQENADGSFLLHRLSDGETILTGRLTNDEIAVWTQDLRYDATAEAAAFIDLRFSGLSEEFSLDRFETGIRDPGLARRVVKGAQLPAAVPLTVPPSLSGDISPSENLIEISVTLDQKRSAKTLEIYQEGVLSETVEVDAPVMTLKVDRVPGARWVSVIARDLTGVASNDLTADLGADPRGAGQLKGVLVGVDIYDDPRLADLNYAKTDVGRIYDALGDPAVGAEEITVLTKSKATPEAILQAVRDLVGDLSAEDHGVLFFAGHGLQDAEGRFYFATPETDLDDLENSALPWKDIAEALATSKARITVLLDACHSGAADGRAFATNDDAVAGLSSIPANVTILSASKGRELSVESAALGGGAFSAGIARVIVSERSKYDMNGNGVLERSEFFAGLKTEMEMMPDVSQTPWMTNTRLVGDYALF